jgi:hypothetical protein
MDTAERTPIEGKEENAPDPVAEKAMAAGWRPLEEYQGDPEAWVDAKEFIKRAPLYEKNHKLKRELAEMKTALHEVKGHISKVSEAAYSRAVADLTARRDEAIDNGDREQVREIDKELKAAESMKSPADSVHPAIAAWEKENGEWFYKDVEITDFGMAFARAHLQRHPEDAAGAMEAMEKAVKKAFPEKFEKVNPQRKAPAAVESGGVAVGKRSFGKSDLNDEQRKVMGKFVRMGIMTEDDYIKDLADSGQIGGKK